MTDLGLAPSRERAKALIMEGIVYVDGVREDKAGTKVLTSAPIEVRGSAMEFVSRGGYKLKKAMEEFPIDLKDAICMDIGASTGGFTDCMLKAGAKKVYSVDVGTNQLDYRLRIDERVVCMEKTNARYLTPEDIEDVPDFVSCDVSFISLGLMLPVINSLLSPAGSGVCLIKPQFEAGRQQVGKNGVVRDPKVHRQVIDKVMGYATDSGLVPMGLSYSPIKGPKGNIEYLLYFKKSEEKESEIDLKIIDEVVDEAHRVL